MLGPHLSQIHVDIADRIGLELFPDRLVTINIGQPANAVTLQTTVKRRVRQMGNRRREAYRQSSSGSSVWRRKVTTTASSLIVNVVERAFLSPFLDQLSMSVYATWRPSFG